LLPRLEKAFLFSKVHLWLPLGRRQTCCPANNRILCARFSADCFGSIVLGDDGCCDGQQSLSWTTSCSLLVVFLGRHAYVERSLCTKRPARMSLHCRFIIQSASNGLTPAFCGWHQLVLSLLYILVIAWTANLQTTYFRSEPGPRFLPEFREPRVTASVPKLIRVGWDSEWQSTSRSAYDPSAAAATCR
jgi:hypothetical protein